jgi:hypothetical protein
VNYMQTLAEEIREILSPDHPPPETNGDELFAIYALVAQIKGVDVDRQDVHDAWATWRTVTKTTNDADLIPFDQLSAASQGRDQPYVDAIRLVAARRNAATG